MGPDVCVVVGFKDWVEWGVYLLGILLQPIFVQLAAHPNRNRSQLGIGSRLGTDMAAT